MSPNIDPVLSYQNSSSADHAPLNLENRGVHSNISDDDTSYHRRGDRRASIEKMTTLIEHLHRRRKRCHPKSFTSWCIVFMLLSWVLYKHSHHQTTIIDGEDSNADNDYIIDTNYIPNLVWNDEFNGDSVDLSKWTFVDGDGCEFNLCGWGNSELEWYNSNAKVLNGRLVIEARKEVVTDTNNTLSSYTSAKIVTRHKADFSSDNLQSTNTTLDRGRRFESRLKLPSGQGIWPAFWMLPTNNTYGGWPRSGEIDIMESIGKEGPNTVHGTVHYGLEWPQHQYAESGITHVTTKDDDKLNETFHTYSVERLPGVIRWYIDDIEYSSITKEDMMPYHWPFDEEFYFIYNLAVGGNWPGMPNEDTIFPQQLEIDYVRVYEDVFPRIVGQSVVEYSANQVVYEVVNLKEVKGIIFTWTVPLHAATIKSGQGTSRIVVDFDSKLMNNTSIIESDIIQVQANGKETLSTSIGLSKLANGIGYRIKIVDYNGLKDFDFDCGRPLTCTKFVLNKITDTEYTCGERIAWLMSDIGMNERDACTEVGYKEFHGHCGPCNPLIEPP